MAGPLLGALAAAIVLAALLFTRVGPGRSAALAALGATVLLGPDAAPLLPLDVLAPVALGLCVVEPEPTARALGVGAAVFAFLLVGLGAAFPGLPAPSWMGLAGLAMGVAFCILVRTGAEGLAGWRRVAADGLAAGLGALCASLVARAGTGLDLPGATVAGVLGTALGGMGGRRDLVRGAGAPPAGEEAPAPAGRVDPDLVELSGVFEDLGAPYLLVDEESGRVVEANASAARLAGRTREELVGSSVDTLFDRPPPSRGVAGDLHVLRCGRPPLPVVVRVGLGPGGHRMIAVRDRSAEPERFQDRVQAERMAAISRIAGGIAHDFNNLLQGILGYAAWLGPDASAQELVDGLEAIRRLASRGSQLARAMRDLGGEVELAEGRCDAVAVVRGMREVVARGMVRTATVELDLVSGAAWVDLDRGRLEELLLALVLNARDAMAPGDRLVLAVARRRLGPAEAMKWALNPGDYVEVRVEDTGSGMPPEVRQHAFEPYVTTRPGAAGMGLSVVWSVVRSRGGGVSLDSRLGEGTRVTVLLPEAQPPAERPEAPAPSPAQEGGGPLRLLVVDDEPDLREMLEVILGSRGLEVLAVGSGEEALDHLRSGTPFDVVLLDVVMPGMDGGAVLAAMRDEGLQVPVVLASGYAPEDLAFDTGPPVVGHLRKPFLPDDLLELLAR